MSPEIKEKLTYLNIKNGYWTDSFGEKFKICHQHEFICHTICVNRRTQLDILKETLDIQSRQKYNWNISNYCIDNRIDPYKTIREVKYLPLYDNDGRYTFKEWFNTPEELEKLFNNFILGYKEYRVLKKKIDLEKDFDDN